MKNKLKVVLVERGGRLSKYFLEYKGGNPVDNLEVKVVKRKYTEIPPEYLWGMLYDTRKRKKRDKKTEKSVTPAEAVPYNETISKEEIKGVLGWDDNRIHYGVTKLLEGKMIKEDRLELYPLEDVIKVVGIISEDDAKKFDKLIVSRTREETLKPEIGGKPTNVPEEIPSGLDDTADVDKALRLAFQPNLIYRPGQIADKLNRLGIEITKADIESIDFETGAEYTAKGRAFNIKGHAVIKAYQEGKFRKEAKPESIVPETDILKRSKIEKEKKPRKHDFKGEGLPKPVTETRKPLKDSRLYDLDLEDEKM